jgi:hypothetical protein
MAKIIKCPKCGENVEIPPNAAGTVVKCGACGAGLRVKARTQPAAGDAERSHGSMSGSVGGSMSGTVVNQTGYGQPAPQEPDPDGPPSLGSDCAVCGRSVDPDDLVEDRGKLVCSRCARRRVGHVTAGAAEPLQSGPEPDYNPALRHGPMISINAAFLTGCAALLVAGAAQAYLYLNEKPVGTRMIARAGAAPATKRTIPTVVSWEDQNRETIQRMIDQARELVGTDAPAAVAKYDELFNLIGNRNILSEPLKSTVDAARADRAKLATELAARSETPDASANVPTTMTAPQEAVATNTEPVVRDPVPPPQDPEEVVVDPPKPQNIFELPPDAPELLEPALRALADKNYAAAAEAIRNVRPPSVPGRDQRLILETQAAINLGLGKYDLAEGQLKRAGESFSSSGVPVTRSLVLNRALAQLGGRKPSHVTARDLMAYITERGGQPDEAIHAALGTAVSRVPVTAKERDELVNFLNSYTSQLDASQAAQGKRRWGGSWADAEKVRAAEEYIATVNEQIKALEPQLEKYLRARENAAALSPASFPQADANYKRVYGQIDARRQELEKYEPRWLEKFEPVMPEVEESAAPPPPVPADPASAPPPPPVPDARPAPQKAPTVEPLPAGPPPPVP